MKALVEFNAPEDAKRAAIRLLSLGYVDVESYGPFPVSDEDAHAPRGSIVLSCLAFCGGACGLAGAYFVQWYANAASYRLNIGGRPTHAAPAFIPISFEMVCLCATAALFLGFLIVERLPRLWQPVFEIEGFEHASIDRFWLAVELRDGKRATDELTADLALNQPLRIVVSEEGA